MSIALDKFRNRHPGASFAILGSSPTLTLYRNQEDITIGVNGAAVALPDGNRMDYFMCGDKDSPARQWFLGSERFNATRIVAAHVLPFDPVVIPDHNERQALQRRLRDFVAAGNIRSKFRLGSYSIQTKHGFFEYSRPWAQKISPRQRRLAMSGTISGVAAQMALVMGAASIHLYGCSFGSVDGVHYAYDSKGEPGMIKFSQPAVMDFILSQIRLLGTKVYAHGPTALRMAEPAQ